MTTEEATNKAKQLLAQAEKVLDTDYLDNRESDRAIALAHLAQAYIQLANHQLQRNKCEQPT